MVTMYTRHVVDQVMFGMW